MKDAALAVNWFDFVALAMLIVGVVIGRKRGMSCELLDVFQWLLIVFLAALACDPFGRFLADVSGFGPVTTYVTAYLLAAGGIKLLFVLLKRAAGEKLVGSDVFGSLEYYLGMLAGAVRFACITMFALALLHAKPVNPEQLAAQIKYQQENLGEVFFPPFGKIQEAVFQDSFTGKLVVDHLSSQLINVDPSAGGGDSRENIGRARDRELNEMMKK
jgi:uncharacterized membrane protein required for colicin V production